MKYILTTLLVAALLCVMGCNEYECKHEEEIQSLRVEIEELSERMDKRFDKLLERVEKGNHTASLTHWEILNQWGSDADKNLFGITEWQDTVREQMEKIKAAKTVKDYEEKVKFLYFSYSLQPNKIQTMKGALPEIPPFEIPICSDEFDEAFEKWFDNKTASKAERKAALKKFYDLWENMPESKFSIPQPQLSARDPLDDLFKDAPKSPTKK